MEDNSLEEKTLEQEAKKLLENLEDRQPKQGAILAGFLCGILKTWPLQFKAVQRKSEVLSHPIISSQEGFDEAKK